MSLKNIYKSQTTSYSNNNVEWVHFLKDHHQYLVDNSSYIEIDSFKQETMTYRFEDFLADNNYPKPWAWIILMINQLSSNNDFIGLTTLRVPNQSILEQLKVTFSSIQSNKKRAQK